MGSLWRALRYAAAVIFAGCGAVLLIALLLSPAGSAPGVIVIIAAGFVAAAYFAWPRPRRVTHLAGQSDVAPSAVPGHRIIRREVRQRGFFGWVFLLLFFAFNGVMTLWLVNYWTRLAAIYPAGEMERTGHAVGSTLGTGFLLVFWAAGAVITGLLALLSRGRRTIIEEKIE